MSAVDDQAELLKDVASRLLRWDARQLISFDGEDSDDKHSFTVRVTSDQSFTVEGTLFIFFRGESHSWAIDWGLHNGPVIKVSDLRDHPEHELPKVVDYILNGRNKPNQRRDS